MSLPWWDATQETPTILEGSQWDYLTLGSFELPGILEEPPKIEPGRKVDKKNGPGLDGATLTWHGYEPSEVTIKLLLWTEEQWTTWVQLLPFILPKPGKPPADPFDVDHPMLAAYGIEKMMVTKVSGLEKAGRGIMRVTITGQHWVKTTNTGTVTPKASSANIPSTVHDQKGGYTPAAIGPPAPPQPPSRFNVKP